MTDKKNANHSIFPNSILVSLSLATVDNKWKEEKEKSYQNTNIFAKHFHKAWNDKGYLNPVAIKKIEEKTK